jgi:hypothetical protein
MSLAPSKLGAEPKKTAALAALVLVAIVVYFWNRNSDSGEPARPGSTVSVGGAKTVVRPGRGLRVTQSGLGKSPKEYRPSIKAPKDWNPESVDPTLHLGRLVVLQDVKLEASSRSLFEISAAPPPSPDQKLAEIGTIKPKFPTQGPTPPPPPPPPPPTPKAPPIPLKFYGFVNPLRPDVKRAFFLEKDEIIVAGEGDIIKKRYKILRIGVNSAEVEDTEFKGDNTKQTLPLETELQG